ncbi:hypothetical protein [Pseudomonas sp. TUM22785]|uniref:hypothetical protein n=1 Tax=Pseudomonas sp. TUM22785 TaxID=3019098 RepID=UPI00230655DC|nr:hypothetical protein [Pseudomonas sp. TUM22785]WCD78085.1 hypothetical protein PI990_18975 [Pseudomonas sp. TUM22785]
MSNQLPRLIYVRCIARVSLEPIFDQLPDTPTVQLGECSNPLLAPINRGQKKAASREAANKPKDDEMEQGATPTTNWSSALRYSSPPEYAPHPIANY